MDHGLSRREALAALAATPLAAQTTFPSVESDVVARHDAASAGRCASR